MQIHQQKLNNNNTEKHKQLFLDDEAPSKFAFL